MKRQDKNKTLREQTAKAIEIYGDAKITYEQAKESGILFYWTGIPCSEGHLTYSYTSTRRCRTCSLSKLAESRYSEVIKESEVIKPRLKAEKLKYDMELKKLEQDYDYDFD